MANEDFYGFSERKKVGGVGEVLYPAARGLLDPARKVAGTALGAIDRGTRGLHRMGAGPAEGFKPATPTPTPSIAEQKARVAQYTAGGDGAAPGSQLGDDSGMGTNSLNTYKESAFPAGRQTMPTREEIFNKQVKANIAAGTAYNQANVMPSKPTITYNDSMPETTPTMAPNLGDTSQYPYSPADGDYNVASNRDDSVKMNDVYRRMQESVEETPIFRDETGPRDAAGGLKTPLKPTRFGSTVDTDNMKGGTLSFYGDGTGDNSETMVGIERAIQATRDLRNAYRESRGERRVGDRGKPYEYSPDLWRQEIDARNAQVGKNAAMFGMERSLKNMSPGRKATYLAAMAGHEERGRANKAGEAIQRSDMRRKVATDAASLGVDRARIASDQMTAQQRAINAANKSMLGRAKLSQKAQNDAAMREQAALGYQRQLAADAFDRTNRDRQAKLAADKLELDRGKATIGASSDYYQNLIKMYDNPLASPEVREQIQQQLQQYLAQ